MRKTLVAGLAFSVLASSGVDLSACGDKFLVFSRGTRYQTAAAARRFQGKTAPMVVPVALTATGTELALAKKEFERVLKGPIKSQSFLEAIDDAISLRDKLRASAS